MKTASLPIPGLMLGTYPERNVPEPDFLAGLLDGLRSRIPASARRYERFAQRVLALEAASAVHDDAALAKALHGVRARMSRDGLADDPLADAFALVARSSRFTLGLRPYASQIMAARIMLDGRLAEMATGEGKTLAAGLCAAVAALAGIPVHVVTANDYLVTRDAGLLLPLYRSLGLRVATVTQPLATEQRRAAYGCDVTYCTARELAFDYLRDSLVRGGARLLRGLCTAIVDEADSVFIDEACVPLVISERRANATQIAYHARALDLAARLEAGRDFTLDARAMQANLTREGRNRLESALQDQGGVWRNRMHREEAVATALAALHLYVRDRHYLVRAKSVSIIDESSGRAAPGRTWSRGLQQMIEIREGCPPSAETVTAAQITYQGFFRRYLRLGGMSGTLRESRAELQSVYGLHVVAVPLRTPSRRRVLPGSLHVDREAQWDAVVAQVRTLLRARRPVLVGTDSVAESEELSRRFHEAQIPHALLNARQDDAEARIIEQAGAAGRVTIATNMAGRGTDIHLGEGVAAAGGLHVICCQHNSSRRIDRQLAGRCARQGDPGSVQTMLSADKPLIAGSVPGWVLRLLSRSRQPAPRLMLEMAIRLPQRLEENRRRAQRRELLRRDLRADRLPAPLAERK